MKIFGITGYKNAGKTGLMERLVSEITGRGLTVSTIKHAHHRFDIDRAGKDSYRHRAAGAQQVMLASRHRWALMTETPHGNEAPLEDLIAQLSPVDLVLVEGYKEGAHPKIEAYRAVLDHPLRAADDPTIRAVASDTHLDIGQPVLDLDDTCAIADFILAQVGIGAVFDTVLMVDWSAANAQRTQPKADAIWYCVARDGIAGPPVYCRSRQEAEPQITAILARERAAGRRVLAGFDFAFGYPAGFGEALTGSTDPFAVWNWFAERVSDGPKANNRFDLAGEINAMFPGVGPFWANGLKRDIPHLPRKGTARTGQTLPERRQAETHAPRAFPVWQLAGAGAVGSQVIMGLPMLARLRDHFGADLSVWPFAPPDRPITLVEIWPSLIDDVVKETIPEGRIKDAHQVQLLAQTIARMDAATLAMMFDAPATPEGWIFGLTHKEALAHAARGTMSGSEATS